MIEPNIVQVRPAPRARQHQRFSQLDLDYLARSRAPNYTHLDGRVYASAPGEDYYAVTVSPVNPRFSDQIEPQVLPIVQALLAKNYLTVSSCQGHCDRSELFVRVVFGSAESAEAFRLHWQGLDGVYTQSLDTSANVEQYQVRGRVLYQPIPQGNYVSSQGETADINRLFGRRYNRVCYVDVRQDLRITGITRWIARWRERLGNDKPQIIASILDRIQTLKVYEL